MENIELLALQRAFFRSGRTLPLSFRRDALRRLEQAVRDREGELKEALARDLHKSGEEAWLTEIGPVLGELRDHRRHLSRWSRTLRPPTPPALFPSRSRIRREPYGTVLVAAPWNYPLQLLLMPLAGVISAGNCAVLKPAETAPHVAEAVGRLIASCFPPEYVAVRRMDHAGLADLIRRGPDYVFFTGSPEAGREIMGLASEALIPVTLELGGKSPCIVTESADVEIAARRIMWAKLLNAGQTCVAPDHVWVHRSVRDGFVAACARAVSWLYRADGGAPRHSAHYARIVSTRHFDRLLSLLENGVQVLYGGETDREERYFGPTLVGADETAPVMQEEIFGPILPVLVFDREEKLAELLQGKPRPLALYYFGKEAAALRFLERVPSGGACINDALLHLANRRLPFGGVGRSGMGSYHGRRSFETFSRERSVLISSACTDLVLKYPPYRITGFRWRSWLGL